jgi:hypothetical protein
MQFLYTYYLTLQFVIYSLYLLSLVLFFGVCWEGWHLILWLELDLKHLGTSNPPASAFLSAGTMDAPRFIPVFTEILVYIK